MANGDGITYTTKELLERVDKKLDALDEKLDRKADAATVVALESRLLVLERQAASQDAVNVALRDQADKTSEKAATNFTKREKVLAGCIGLLSILFQVANSTGVFH